jgi:uncharacterized membrane protein YidH (DUF202 family)
MVLSILFWTVVVLLVLVTGGIAYLTFLNWQDSQRAQKKRPK